MAAVFSHDDCQVAPCCFSLTGLAWNLCRVSTKIVLGTPTEWKKAESKKQTLLPHHVSTAGCIVEASLILPAGRSQT